ncbi:MAG: acetyl-CoA decarbonylase/synthase complex subunit delta [Omnitrophica bacterium RBG_13_46_9]|nr:MAG: acetyl-CoA decarbonylase/synthase complex subunit delta [Omnitrophica bacterium RBG_13_46_9]
MEIIKENWTGKINEVTIGATAKEGGTRASHVTIGGQTTLPFLYKEGNIPNAPVIAMEILDIEPIDWPDSLKRPFGDSLKDPVKWAVKCAVEHKAPLLCVRLAGTHPDFGNKSAADAARLIKDILQAVKVPLIIIGSGDDEKDNAVLAKVSEVSKGEKCLIGDATEKNYKTLTASCLADGHDIIAESPIDINIAKQVNILISEMGFPLDRIAINPTIGALGYGIEYAYSIMERARTAALIGDKMLSMPFVCFIGYEAWRAKEAKSTYLEHPEWGDEFSRGPLWEAQTAVCVLQAGADILIMRHPKAVEETRKYIDTLMKH